MPDNTVPEAIIPIPSGSDLVRGDSSTGDVAESQVGTAKLGGVSPSVAPPKKFPILLLFLIPILVIIAVIAIYVLLQARTMYQQTIVIPSPSPTPIVSADPTADWQTYANPDLKFSFKVPQSWSNYSMKDFSKIPFTYTETFLYIGPGDVTTRPPQLMQITISNEINYKDTVLYPPENCALTNLTIGIDKIPAKHTLCKGMESNGYIVFKIDKMIYQIDELKSTDENHRLFDQILSTFKFTGQTSTYTCPPSGYIDCMPGPDSSKQKTCSPEAMAWYKTSCPDFQGGAL